MSEFVEEEAEAPGVVEEEAEEATVAGDGKVDKGYNGKYEWDEGAGTTVAASDAMGSKIVDYAWSDGKKKVSVYVTLEGLDALEDEALEATLLGPGSVSFRAVFPETGERKLDLNGIFGEVKAVSFIRKKGRDQVVLKLEKKLQNDWYDLLKPKNMSGGFADHDDDDDEDEDNFQDLEDPEGADEYPDDEGLEFSPAEETDTTETNKKPDLELVD